MTTLAEARLRACKMWPYGSQAILSLVPVEQPGLGTMAVDKHWRLYYDKQALGEQPVEESAGIILHEVSHLLLVHHRRAERYVAADGSQAEWDRWNVATDYAINSMLRKQGIKLSDRVLYPEQDGYEQCLTGEEYFRLLTAKAEKQPSADDSPPNGGSCSDGRQRPWEQPSPVECGTPGIKQHEADILARQTAERILEKGQGHGSGAWERWANDILSPRVDPRIALLRLVRHAVESTSGQGDYSYRRPNRRNARPDVLMPSAVQPIPRVTIIVDTSGSMGERDLGLSLGLIGKVLNTFRIRDGIKVVCGDTQAVVSAKVFDPKQVSLAGGGGTDMGSLITEVATHRPRPQLIVVCTDGATPWCDPVGIPVVACLTHEHRVNRVPSWIRTVVLN